jgi:hypothetical protein
VAASGLLAVATVNSRAKPGITRTSKREHGLIEARHLTSITACGVLVSPPRTASSVLAAQSLVCGDTMCSRPVSGAASPPSGRTQRSAPSATTSSGRGERSGQTPWEAGLTGRSTRGRYHPRFNGIMPQSSVQRRWESGLAFTTSPQATSERSARARARSDGVTESGNKTI